MDAALAFARHLSEAAASAAEFEKTKDAAVLRLAAATKAAESVESAHDEAARVIQSFRCRAERVYGFCRDSIN